MRRHLRTLREFEEIPVDLDDDEIDELCRQVKELLQARRGEGGKTLTQSEAGKTLTSHCNKANSLASRNWPSLPGEQGTHMGLRPGVTGTTGPPLQRAMPSTTPNASSVWESFQAGAAFLERQSVRGLAPVSSSRPQARAEASARVREARRVLELLAEAVEGWDGPNDRLLQADLQRLGRCGDSYLFHEQLEEVNEPMYFHEFAQRASA
jgi:hypothetical protein